MPTVAPPIWNRAGHRRLVLATICSIGRRILRDYVIIFGAAVRADGQPSPALQHRIAGAVGWAQSHPRAWLMPTGGLGDQGPAEANVVRRALIAAGIAPDRIISEPCARDTLESVKLSDAILRKRGDCGRVICCTSTYHQPRCALLFKLLGYAIQLPPVPSGWGGLPLASFAWYLLKEVIATPYDACLLLVWKYTAQSRAPIGASQEMVSSPIKSAKR